MAQDGEMRHGRRRIRHPVAALLASVVFVAAAAASYRLAFLQHSDDLVASRVDVASQLDHLRGNLGRELFASINLSEGLVALVRLRSGIQQDEFDALAAAMLSRSSIIRNVALAPGTTIRFVHPLRGNEAALGVDYMGLPNQRAMVVRAITEPAP